MTKQHVVNIVQEVIFLLNFRNTKEKISYPDKKKIADCVRVSTRRKWYLKNIEFNVDFDRTKTITTTVGIQAIHKISK